MVVFVVFFWSRVIPDTLDELVEYFLNNEAQEFEVEIARLRTK